MENEYNAVLENDDEESLGKQAVMLSEEFERESRRYSRRFTEEDEVRIR
ncbi:MAG: hypothetical protein UH080_01195 [Ruminococcus sp.]|nr:hypothetical protein [Ruminococcus sp.]